MPQDFFLATRIFFILQEIKILGQEKNRCHFIQRNFLGIRQKKINKKSFFFILKTYFGKYNFLKYFGKHAFMPPY